MKKYLRKEWVDVSLPLREGMVSWPGDPGFSVQTVKSRSQGNRSHVSSLTMGSHTGTHVDAPYHFVERGMTLDQMPLSVGMGTAKVILIEDVVSIQPHELRRHNIRKGDRILFKTRNSKRNLTKNRFVKNFVYVSKEAAEYLRDRNVALVGIDSLSVGGFYQDGVETHQILLGAGIWIVEGLNLTQIKSGRYDLICLPLPLLKGDGGPARVVLRPQF